MIVIITGKLERKFLQAIKVRAKVSGEVLTEKQLKARAREWTLEWIDGHVGAMYVAAGNSD